MKAMHRFWRGIAVSFAFAGILLSASSAAELNPAAVIYKLPEQIRIFVVNGVGGKINFRLRARRARFRGLAFAFLLAVEIGFARHSFALKFLFDFAMHGVAAEKRIVFFDFQFFRLQFFIARCRVT